MISVLHVVRHALIGYFRVLYNTLLNLFWLVISVFTLFNILWLARYESLLDMPCLTILECYASVELLFIRYIKVDSFLNLLWLAISERSHILCGVWVQSWSALLAGPLHYNKGQMGEGTTICPATQPVSQTEGNR